MRATVDSQVGWECDGPNGDGPEGGEMARRWNAVARTRRRTESADSADPAREGHASQGEHISQGGRGVQRADGVRRGEDVRRGDDVRRESDRREGCAAREGRIAHALREVSSDGRYATAAAGGDVGSAGEGGVASVGGGRAGPGAPSAVVAGAEGGFPAARGPMGLPATSTGAPAPESDGPVAHEREFVRCAVIFLPSEPPRAGKVAFWRPDGGPLPDVAVGRVEEGSGVEEGSDVEGGGGVDTGRRLEGRAAATSLTVVRPHGAGVRRRAVPSVVLPLSDAMEILVRARRDPTAHPAAACWGAAVLHALQLAARGRLLPGLTDEGNDAWRAGPLDARDIAHVRAVAAAMPPEGHAVPLPERSPLELPDPEEAVRSLLDAVVDTLPRTVAAPHVAAGAGDTGAGAAAYAAREAHCLPTLRSWAALVAEGADAGVKVSLRLDLRARELYEKGAPPASAVVQVHSLADPSLVTDALDLWEGRAAEQFGAGARIGTVRALRSAARVWPPLSRLLERPVPDVLTLEEEEFYDLLGPAGGRLSAAGVALHWPRELARDLTATAVVGRAPGTASDQPSFFESGEVFEFRWQLALGGLPLTEQEMDALAETHRPMVRLRDQWVLVDPALVRKARKRRLARLHAVDALAMTLAGTTEVDGERVEVTPVGSLARLRSTLTSESEPLDRPPGLRAGLRDYQLRGLAWLERMTSLGLGGVLADDMGLGKTVTVIALHLHRGRPAAEEGSSAVTTSTAPARSSCPDAASNTMAAHGAAPPTLVICPASLLANWQREIERFAPGVPVRRFHGADRRLDDLGGGFVLTTYGTMRTGAARLAERSWGLVVADEAQHVKNPHSSTAVALRTIPAPARIALTGTPVENNLSELWSLLDWTTPGLLGSLKNFRARHARAIESGEAEDGRAGGSPAEAAERLARVIAPFVLRRKKSDPGILPELPPKTETEHPVAPAREQAALYEAAVREAMTHIENAEGMARRGLIMKLLTSLKQICNHPAQYLREDGGRLAGRSGKLELLEELLDTIVSEGDSALVFTQYVTMARLLAQRLRDLGIRAQLLHGGTPLPRRQEMVDRFQSGEIPVFVLSLKAAGTGLNLTRAGHVIHYDRWWNPAVEEQATDRAYRIGQTRPVQVHRLIAEGTVEDRIAELLDSKRALSDAVLSSGEAALSELTDAELSDLVALRRPS